MCTETKLTAIEARWKRVLTAAVALWALLLPGSCSSEASSAPTATRDEEAPEARTDDDPEREASPTRDASPRGAFRPEIVNILLLGFDGRLTPPGRTDAILVLSLDADAGEIGITSVPRDLWVDIPGLEPGRINTVYRIAEARLGPGTGLPLLKAVLARELGLEIDHTVAVDMQGFAEIVDLLGGVQVDVPCPIMDNFISSESPTGYEPLSLEAGRHRLDGRTALLYSRSRHGRSDLDRSSRQQAVLIGIWRKIARLETIGRLPSLSRKVAGHVRTDIDLPTALELASLVAGTGLDGLHGLVLVEPIVYQWRSPDGRSVLRVDGSLLHEALEGLFDAPKPGKRLDHTCRPADAALHWKEKRGSQDAAEGDAGL